MLIKALLLKEYLRVLATVKKRWLLKKKKEKVVEDFLKNGKAALNFLNKQIGWNKSYQKDWLLKRDTFSTG